MFASEPASLPRADDPRPLVAHVVHRFDIGGLENGVVNLLNRLPCDRYRHVVISLTEITDFRHRVLRDDVAFYALHKPPGQGVRVFPALYRLFRRLGPAIVHTRNLAALEATFPAWLARVPIRVHGEHGRDVGDLDGANRRYRFVRRAYRPFVDRYVALSGDLERYLVDVIGVPAERVARIVNGVDTERFHPRSERAVPPGFPFADHALCVIGTVGRLAHVKHQTLLARAFVRVLERTSVLRQRLRLAIVGDGPLRGDIEAILAHAGVAHLAWLPGARDDVPEVLRALDVFVLPSLAEGISNTILEAMASGLPVIAADVGGNAELVEHGRSGTLVPSDDVDALALAIEQYAKPAVARAVGHAARRRVENVLGLEAMVAHYATLYDELLVERAPGTRALRGHDRLASRGH